MLNVELFRISQELELAESIRAHPAFQAVRAQAPEYWRICDAAACPPHNNDAEPDRQPLTHTAYPEAWAAAARALPLFGVQDVCSLFAVGGAGDTRRDVTFSVDGRGLMIHLPKAILFRLHGAQLAGVIGHGLGHFLLGHTSDADLAALLAVVRAEAVADDGRDDELWDDPVAADLLRQVAALAQLQDLSADRFGLLVAQDLEAVILGAVRQFSDVATDRLHLENITRFAIPAADWREPVFLPHPALPGRALALKLFSESALYREAIGLSGGLDAAGFEQDMRLFLSMSVLAKGHPPIDRDDALLKLILMDSLVVAGRARRPRAERMIYRHFPPGCYEQVMERYDELSDDREADNDLLRPWLSRAAGKAVGWKIAMINRLLYLISLDHRIEDCALGEVATLAAAMGAGAECRSIYAVAFGYDPYCWSVPGLTTLPQARATT